MSSFQVGEVAIGQNHVSWPELNGRECEIVGELRLERGFNPRTGAFSEDFRYRVRWSDGTVTRSRPTNLRKKRPPAADESAAHQVMLDCIERAKQSIKEPA